MQGNGNFVLAADPPPTTSPVKLELRENGDGVVCLVASLDDGTEAYLVCYKKGLYIPFALSATVAARLGIARNMGGSILSGKMLPEKCRMGC